jgi:peptidoglycan/xylan/chitin deacetylase (PgdA/CDA1 family)
VETAQGQENIGALVAVEHEYGITSCWNFPVLRYPVDISTIEDLKRAGHEVGVHGVYHDGRLFSSEAIFRRRLPKMVEAAREWGAVGFRSPSLLYDRRLLEELPFEWDSSMPAWDPFQPRPGCCLRYVPFKLTGHCVELPVTLWQDFTLFEELQLRDIEIWRRQIDVLYELGGLMTVIVHPDYAVTQERRDAYRRLLDYVLNKENVWTALPTDVARWEREEAQA